MILNEEEFDDYLEHYGTPRRSGRYPWGSGGENGDTVTRNQSFADIVTDLRKQGLKDTEICVGLGIGTTDSSGKFRPSTTQLRAKYTISRNEKKQAQIVMAQRLRDKAWSYAAIAQRLELPGESSARALLKEGVKDRVDILTQTSNMLKSEVAAKTYIDVGAGVENHLGLTQTKLNAAVAILKEEGYKVHTVPVPQIGTVHETHVKVLCPPGTTWGDVRRNQDNIKQIMSYTDNGGRSFIKTHPPLSINPDRVGIKFKEDGGDKSDGVIYVRRGVEDISLGSTTYAQVRIKVGDKHYLKGMAMYKDDLPPGVDLLFNTNKPKTNDKLSVMKELSDDPDLPFGSLVRQVLANPGTPNERVTSVINKVGIKEGAGEEGGWETWSKSLASQMLSKQPPTLAKQQLEVTFERRQKELNDILALTNPTVKKKLLGTFADSVDSAAVHLKAAALPKQTTRVLLPINSLPPTQVYAPGFKNGDRVVLVRYPHGGTFEIPELTVTTRHPEGKKLLGNARDAIGIHHSVAKQLSGADFDGDTVIIIPNNNSKVVSSKPLQALKDFDPLSSFSPYDGMKTIDGGIYNAKTKKVDYGNKHPSSKFKDIQMGIVSNLITDMTIRGAPHSEIAKAVKHSMVIIDAEKHHLNYKQSAIDNGIRGLKEKYQGGPRKGASTLISRARKDVYIPDRKLRPQTLGGPIDKETGKLVFIETKKLNYKGEPKLVRVESLAAEEDANNLTSKPPTRIETIYANHSNKLKALANQARLASINTPRLNYLPSANKTYAKQVESLESKLDLAIRNSPLERQAQIIANAAIRAKKQANPNLEKEVIKKITFKALEDARLRTGAKKPKVKITPDEWEAIQAGAISDHKLDKILSNADMEVVKTLATPRTPTVMSKTMTRRAKSMLASNYTRAEVAEQLGVSLTTLDTATKEGTND